MNVIVLTNARYLAVNRAADKEATRENAVTLGLFYSVRLTRKHTLVDLGDTVNDNAVRKHLTAYLEIHYISDDNVRREYIRPHAVTDDRSNGIRRNRKLLNRSYGPFTMPGIPNVVAKYETDKKTYCAYGNGIEQARAFLGIKLYDECRDLIHGHLCRKSDKNNQK